MTLSIQRLHRILALSVLGFAVALLVYWVRTQFLGVTTYPANTFLFAPDQRFHDYIDSCEDARSYLPYTRFTGIYPPFAYLAMVPFFGFKGIWPILAYLLVFGGVLFAWLRRELRAAGAERPGLLALVLGFASYPTIFLMDRGNIEGLCFLFALGFFLWKDRLPRRAAILLGLAAAMKGYPVLFAVGWLRERKWRELGWIALAGGTATLVALLLFSPPVVETVRLWGLNLAKFAGIALRTTLPLVHSSSLYSLIRIAASVFDPRFLGGNFIYPPLAEFNGAYSRAAVPAVLAVSAWAAWGEREPWRRALLVCIAFLLFPQIAYSYRSIFIYIPLVLFLRGEKTRFEGLHCVLFALMLIPRGYWTIAGEITSVSVLTPLALLIWLGLLAFERISRNRAVFPIVIEK